MRGEGSDLVQGKGCYTADIDVGDALFAVFVRSDYAHAAICGIDTSAALAVPGVEAVLTGDDLGTFGGFPAFLRQPTIDGRPLVVPHRPVLATDRVRHVGELIGIVVASTHEAALEASELVEIDYEALDVISGIASAAASDAPLIHENAPGNCAAKVAIGDAEAVAAALEASSTVVELTLELPRLAPAPMENRAVVAAFDADAGVYDLWTPHQGIGEIRRDLAAVLAGPADAIRVHSGHVGGAFGARGAAYPEHAALLAAARKTGRRLRWQATRVESFVSDYHGRGTRLTGRLGLDAKGRFTAIDVRFDADLGAYLNPVGAHINVANPLQTLTGCYRIPQAAARFGLYFTNAVPIGPFRGAGRPDIAYLIERLVDEAAVRLKIDRLALRRRNVVPVSAFPYKTPAGAVYDSGDYSGLLERASAAADWKGFTRRQRASSKRGRLRGIGASLFVEVAGGGPVPHDEVSLRIDFEENRPVLVIETVSKNTGQGHAESYRKIVAERLGLEPDAIRLDESPPDSRLVGAGSFASRSMAAIGEALSDACDKLALALCDVVAARQGESGEALHVADHAVLRADGSFVTKLRDVLAEASRATPPLRVVGRADVASTFPSGCHIAEVEVDPDTGVTRLVSYVAVDDAGNIISPAIVEGQIVGGIVQGVGSVLGERIVYDEDGQLVTSSFMDYAMPRADDLPTIEVLTMACPSPRNRLGVKGVGEAGTTGAIPAVANAVIDALRARGVDHLDIPFTPARVWRAVHRFCA
jgi:carbon-monoxide dehydrogenase large subunit